MQKSFSIDLPWPPSINHYWRHARNGHTFISDKGRYFRTIVMYATRNLQTKFTSCERLSLTIDAYPPDRRKRDLDNILKSLLDALQHAGIYSDDSQIDILKISRICSFDGFVKVNIEAII